MKKRYFTALLAAVMLMAGCSQNNTPSTESADADNSQFSVETQDLLSEIQERGDIIVAMEGAWAPWTYHDESDILVGYDVEVAREIAQKLGVEVTFVEVEWDSLLAGLLLRANFYILRL